jgi:hypothetical protein
LNLVQKKIQLQKESLKIKLKEKKNSEQ